MFKAAILCLFFSLASTLPAQESWDLFASKDGLFTVMSPAVLQEKLDTFETDLGVQIQHTFFHADYDGVTDNYLYMISYHDFPVGTIHKDSTALQVDFLENTIDQAVQSLGGELVYKDGFYAGSNPGRIFKISYNEGTAVVKTKIYLVGDRFYSARVFGTSDKDPNNDMNRFLDSFRPLEP